MGGKVLVYFFSSHNSIFVSSDVIFDKRINLKKILHNNELGTPRLCFDPPKDSSFSGFFVIMDSSFCWMLYYHPCFQFKSVTDVTSCITRNVFPTLAALLLLLLAYLSFYLRGPAIVKAATNRPSESHCFPPRPLALE